MALPEHLAEFERRVAARLSDAVDEMRRSLHAQAERASTQLLTDIESFRPAMPETLLNEKEVAGLASPSRRESRAEVLRELLDAVAALDSAATQGAALEALLAAARGGDDTSPRRAAIWLTHEDGLVGWGSAGFGTNGDDPLAGARLAYAAAPALERLARGRGTVRLASDEAARIASELEIRAPHAAALVPLVLRDHLAAALYVDRLDGEGDLELERLQLLAHAASQRLELQGLTARAYTPTLVLEEEAPGAVAGLPLWDPAALGATAEPEAAALPPAIVAWESAPSEPTFELDAGPTGEAESPSSRETETLSMPAFSGFELSPEPLAMPTFAGYGGEKESFFEPESETVEQAVPTFDLGHPALDAPPAERFVLQPPPVEPLAAAGGSAAEIAWEMEEADSTVLVDSASAARSQVDEVTTGRIPLPDPASFQREITAESEVVESTAEFVPPPSPQATQAFRTGGIATHEFALPEPPPPPPAPSAPPAPDLGDDETVLVRRTAPVELPLSQAPISNATVALPVEPPPSASLAPPPAAPVSGVDDEPTVSRARTTEVLPPPDVQGPGWAFTSSRTQRPTGENALHEEARRLARLLISEIKLYNEEQVEEGRRNRDVYHRLKDDIDRSRQIFEERVHESVRSSTDYFQQELVRSLAGGDPRALGI